MNLRLLALLGFGILLSGAVVVDRVAIIVGKRVVKTSDLERDLRVSQFLNRQPLDLSPANRRKVADRLITQELIHQEVMNGGYSRPTEKDVDAFVQKLKRDRFSNSDAQLRSALARYELTEDELRQYLLWQLTVLRFIDERFRPGVLVTDEDVRAYYEANLAELQKANPKNSSREALESTIRETLIGERVNQNFEEWLTNTRQRLRIEYRDPILREGTATQGAKK
jgi:hypothetical protein